MYLWIGLGMKKAEAEQTRTHCRRKNLDGVDEVAFALPQHVSLKSSFQTEQYEEIVAYLKDKYKALHKLTLEVEGVAQVPGIIWLKMKENDLLRNMHNDVNSDLLQRFGVPLTGFDGEGFAFHSTLFFDPDAPEKVAELFESLRNDAFYSQTITIDSMYFGISPNGKAGAYSVIDTFELI